MRHFIKSAIAVAIIGIASTTAGATDRPAPKGPPKTMGDEGKLPATEQMRRSVPDMTGSDSAATGTSSGTSGSSSDGRHRMGDEPGKLPATGTMSGKMPEMRGPKPQTPPQQ